MTTRSDYHTDARSSNGASLDPEDLTDIGKFVDSLVDETKEYIAVQRELLAMNAYQRVAKFAGGLLSGLLVAVLAFAVLAFCSVALAIWLGTLMVNMALGFLIVGGLYLVVFLAFWFIWRGGMKDRFALNIINSFHDDKD
jgi:hypothetical protein